MTVIDLTVIRPGTPVRLRGDLAGVVLQVGVRAGGAVWYQVSWWSANDRHNDWLEAWELEPAESAPPPVRIGFLPGGGKA